VPVLRFNPIGCLDPGDYKMNFDELRRSLLVVGPGANIEPGWDAQWRLHLVNQAEVLVSQLWQIGVTEIFLDGSFVEQKSHPNDIDGYFVFNDLLALANGDLEKNLNALDPYKSWTWDPHSRKGYRGYPKKQLPMWHRYRVELYPHVPILNNKTGIRDKYGNDMIFPSAFRTCRDTWEAKGIIQIIR